MNHASEPVASSAAAAGSIPPPPPSGANEYARALLATATAINTLRDQNRALLANVAELEARLANAQLDAARSLDSLVRVEALLWAGPEQEIALDFFRNIVARG